jgi:hypothetical protein
VTLTINCHTRNMTVEHPPAVEIEPENFAVRFTHPVCHNALIRALITKEASSYCVIWLMRV